MSTLNVLNMKGQAVGEVLLSDRLLETKRGAQAVHEAVVAYRANQRQGTASTKTKGTVAGSGKKPWRQKGTGRARAGYKQSPVWRGGGVVFGPHPRDYSRTLNKKSMRLALRRAFSDKVQAGTVTVLDGFTLSSPKTKEFVTALRRLKAERGALLVLDQVAPDVVRASRNVQDVEVVSAAHLNVYQVLRYPRLVISRPGLDALQKRLGGEERKAS
jgi:large subunit ribosomal protein L4